MVIKVNIAGMDVPINLTDEQIEGIRHEVELETESVFAKAIVREYLAKAVYELGVTLTDEEIGRLLQKCPFPEVQSRSEFIIGIVTGDLYESIKREVTNIIDSRARYYTVSMSATYEFNIVVKAKSSQEAEKYAENLCYEELSDYLDESDADFYVYGAGTSSSEPPEGDYFEADV